VIVVTPGDIPVTIPDNEPIVAIPGKPELQTPPVGVQVRLIVEPTHTVDGPVIGPGIGLTVIDTDAEQPVGKVYVITTTPGATAVIIPESDPTVAIVVLPLLHIPPRGEAGKMKLAPTQTLTPVDTPITGVGSTVIVVVAKHPVGSI
jgi:hypothetical protein